VLVTCAERDDEVAALGAGFAADLLVERERLDLER
jgi:hypothetical protein